MELYNDNLDKYFIMIKNLDNNEKLKLITKITNSILENNNNEEDILKCFGKLQTEESAEEIIDKIYKARNFENRDISL